MRTLFKNRNNINLIRDLEDNNEILFRNFCRMSLEDFDHLLNLVTPQIKKNTTHLRETISPKERLLLTLRFLASGDSYASLMFLFRISKQSISKIVPEVCKTIINSLKDYVKVSTYLVLIYFS